MSEDNKWYEEYESLEEVAVALKEHMNDDYKAAIIDYKNDYESMKESIVKL